MKFTVLIALTTTFLFAACTEPDAYRPVASNLEDLAYYEDYDNEDLIDEIMKLKVATWLQRDSSVRDIGRSVGHSKYNEIRLDFLLDEHKVLKLSNTRLPDAMIIELPSNLAEEARQINQSGIQLPLNLYSILLANKLYDEDKPTYIAICDESEVSDRVLAYDANLNQATVVEGDTNTHNILIVKMTEDFPELYDNKLQSRNATNVLVSRYRINDLRESWAKGRAEVTMVAQLREGNVNSSTAVESYLGTFDKYPRNRNLNGTVYSSAYTSVGLAYVTDQSTSSPTGNVLSPGRYINVAVFEQDAINSGNRRTVTFPYDGSSLNFYSNDNIYARTDKPFRWVDAVTADNATVEGLYFTQSGHDGRWKWYYEANGFGLATTPLTLRDEAGGNPRSECTVCPQGGYDGANCYIRHLWSITNGYRQTPVVYFKPDRFGTYRTYAAARRWDGPCPSNTTTVRTLVGGRIASFCERELDVPPFLPYFFYNGALYTTPECR